MIWPNYFNGNSSQTLLDKTNEEALLKSPHFIFNIKSYLMAYDYNVVTTNYSTTKSTDFFDLCKLINLAISKQPFDPNVFDIIYRLLRLSSQTSQLVPRSIIETVSLTIETGIGFEQRLTASDLDLFFHGKRNACTIKTMISFKKWMLYKCSIE